MLDTECGVHLDLGPRRGVERSRPAQDLLRHAQLAHIVKFGRTSQSSDAGRGPAYGDGNRGGDAGRTPGVARRPGGHAADAPGDGEKRRQKIGRGRGAG